ncbi:hypothetical protein [Candidatus Enterovibrio escicola]|nr:hypothetical protein [Candidatus Enterovibrio escacola]
MFFPFREESLVEVVNIDENTISVIHAKLLMQTRVFSNDQIATLAFN